MNRSVDLLTPALKLMPSMFEEIPVGLTSTSIKPYESITQQFGGIRIHMVPSTHHTHRDMHHHIYETDVMKIHEALYNLDTKPSSTSFDFFGNCQCI